MATFISETFNPFERKQREIDLLKLYHSTLRENGISGYSFDDCFNDYRISMLEILNLSEGKLDLLDMANDKNFSLLEMKEIIATMLKEKIILNKTLY